MNITTELVVRFTVAVVISASIAYAACWVLSIFLWGWLAVILSLLISFAAGCTEPVHAVNTRLGNLAVEGAARALNAFDGLRARLTA